LRYDICKKIGCAELRIKSAHGYSPELGKLL
jgi:hypothetical protein